ncbi:MAG: peptide deformylase [Verrucomicrobia bacterium]|nr:peptide deformylase [Verrucomicrobiota bacterium]MBS0646081.1 peptide deformylase [Verrucomicrobiota bacterium]
MSLQMRYYGDPILRQHAKPIDHVTEEIVLLARDMIEVMQKQNGIGLAAPQVGVALRIFVTTVYPDQEDGESTYGEPRVFINPVISHPSADLVEMSEGCLSIPGVSEFVWRPESIEFEAMDLEGNIIKERISGFWARVCMHEIDHLNGVLYVDRIKGKVRNKLEPILRRIKKEHYE